jgi:hypothetical protein
VHPYQSSEFHGKLGNGIAFLGCGGRETNVLIEFVIYSNNGDAFPDSTLSSQARLFGHGITRSLVSCLQPSDSISRLPGETRIWAHPFDFYILFPLQGGFNYSSATRDTAFTDVMLKPDSSGTVNIGAEHLGMTSLRIPKLINPIHKAVKTDIKCSLGLHEWWKLFWFMMVHLLFIDIKELSVT